MILNLFLTIVYYLLYAITSPLRLLPDVQMDGGFSTAIINAGGYLKSLDSFIPVATILTILGLYITIELGYLTYKGIMWFIKRFPTQS